MSIKGSPVCFLQIKFLPKHKLQPRSAETERIMTKQGHKVDWLHEGEMYPEQNIFGGRERKEMGILTQKGISSLP